MRAESRIPILVFLAAAGQVAAAWTAIPDIHPKPERNWRPGYIRPGPRLACDLQGNAYLSTGDSLYLGAQGAAWEAAAVQTNVARTIPAAVGDGLLLWGNRRSFDRGRTWDADSVLSTATALAVFEDGRVLAGGVTDAIHMSEDSALTWKYSRKGRTFGYISAFAVMPGGWAAAAPMNDSLLATVDGGATWATLRGTGLIRARMLAADPDPSDPRIWALDAGTVQAPYLHSLKRDGGGVSVSTLMPVRGYPDSTPTSLAVSRSSGGRRRLWMGTWGQGVFVSEDGGSAWEPRNDGLTDLHVGAVAVTSAGRALALTWDGLFAEDLEPMAMGTRPAPAVRAHRMPGCGASPLFPGPEGGNPGGPFRADGRMEAPLLPSWK